MKRHGQNIITAAVAEFSRHGFQKTHVDDIARRAGIGKGTVYLYYPSKSALFAGAVTQGLELLIEKVKEELESELPFITHFQKLIEVNVGLFIDYGSWSRVFFSETPMGLDRKALQDIQAIRNRYIDFLATMLEEGQQKGYLKPVDARLAAVAIVGFLGSLCQHHLKNKGKTNRQEIVKTSFCLLSSGLLAQPETLPAPLKGNKKKQER